MGVHEIRAQVERVNFIEGASKSPCIGSREHGPTKNNLILSFQVVKT